MSIIANNLLQGDEGYNLTRSLRFRSSATAYLTRTFSTPTNNKVWTWSAWVKRGSLSLADANHLFFASPTDVGGNPTTYARLVFETDGTLRLQSNASAGELFTSSALFRDPAAWYHIILYMDAVNTTVRCYVNGAEITYASRTNPTNTNTAINGSGNYHRMGLFRSAEPRAFDGYMTEVNFIDGQALTPSSFGETDLITGVWKPKKYAGTYGTNGFYLPFTDNSSLSNLTADKSGNSNNWTANNISLTAGTTYDSMIDVPTVSALASNYAVWNPLVLFPNTTYQATMSNANMLMTRSGGGQGGAVTTIGVTSGKFYAEMPVTAVGGSVTKLGVMATNNPPSISAGSEYALGDTSASVAYRSNGARLTGGTTTNSWGDTYTTNDVIGVAFDADTGKIWFAKNGTWQASGDPAAGTNQAATLPTAVPFYFSAGGESGISIALNCGQRPFSYTPPTGFVALNTFNLPEPSIKQGNKHFDIGLYTGNGSATARAISGVANPDFVWIKGRSIASSHALYDTLRGFAKRLYTNVTNAEYDYGSAILAPTATGFNLTTADADHNSNGSTYLGWQWKAGGTGVTNTAGSITSQVSANTTAGFSVVTYTGNGTSGATVGHGLGVAPKMVIVKFRKDVAADGPWYVYHSSLGATKNLILNTTAAEATASTPWNNTAPSSSVFSLGNAGDTNGSGRSFVAYCWAEIAGYSAFGSYTGNGSTDGTFVYTGFRPRYVMIKNATGTASANTGWYIFDAARNTYNTLSNPLRADLSDAESSGYAIDFLSNGFKLRVSDAGINSSAGATHIFAAFAENPFKNSLAR